MITSYNILSQDAFWRVNKQLTRSIGDFSASAFLSYLVDKEEYHKNAGTLIKDEGETWFYATSDRIEADTCLSYRQQKTSIKALVAAGLLQTKVMGLPAKVHFSIEHNKIVQIVTTSISESAKLDYPKAQNNNKNKVNKNKVIRERGASAPAPISEQESNRVNDTIAPSPDSAPPPSPQDEFIKRATFSPQAAAIAGIRGPKHPEGLPDFEQGSIAAYESILDRVAADIKSKNDWEYQVSSAGLKMTKEQFFVELKNWIKRNQNSYPFYCRPERVIRGGRASFASWLGNDISRGKYGANKQERRKVIPTLISRSPIRKTFTDLDQIA